MKYPVLRIKTDEDIPSLSQRSLVTMQKTLTYKAFNQIREDPATYTHLQILCKLPMDHIAMFEVGSGWFMLLDDAEREKYRAALFFAKKELSTEFRTRSKNTHLLFMNNDSESSGFIPAVQGFKFAHIEKDELQWLGNTLVYFFGVDDNKSMAMVAVEWGTPGCETRDDASRLITHFIAKRGTFVQSSRVCCVCYKIGNPKGKEFSHCPCDRERRYCSADCQKSDWKTHKPEHLMRMQASPKAEQPVADFEKLSVSAKPSQAASEAAASQGAASSAAELPTCVVCGEQSTLTCPCGTRYCSKSCQKKAWPDHRRGCSGKQKA